MLGPEASQEQVDILREELGLNRSLPVRYFDWLAGAVTGDLGESVSFDQPVISLIGQKFPVTAALSGISLLITILVSFPLGMLAARRPGKFADQLISILGHVFFAIPPFVLALLLTLLLGLFLNLIVIGNYVSYEDHFWGFIGCLIVPAIAIVIPKAGMTVKFLRASILVEKEKDYVRTAKSHGLSDTAVMYRHILPNSLVPILTVLSIIFSDILGGSLIVEQTFNLPGLGRLLVQSIGRRDFPLTEGIVLYLAAMIVIVYFANDLLHSLIDPRIRLK
jgi:ABC-type dipeptide/oligopeptide/nickel transport system permease component